MTNPPTPAPRPCTLWGSTFEANHYWYVLFCNSKHGEAARVAVLSNDKHPVRKHMQIASHLAESADGFKVLPTARPAGELIQEAYFTIYQALHPPLCMKHALEIGYEFEILPLFCVKEDVDCPSPPKIVEGWEIDQLKFIGGWFYPVNHLGQPSYSDAEAVVNAWEGE